MVSPTPPRGNRSAIGAPSSTKTKHATASANFLWISTPYEFIRVALSISRIRSDSTLDMSAGSTNGLRIGPVIGFTPSDEDGVEALERVVDDVAARVAGTVA